MSVVTLEGLRRTKEKQTICMAYYNEPHAIEGALTSILDGGVVAGQMYGVFGIWLNARNHSAVSRAFSIKDEKPKPMTTVIPAERFISLVDLEALPETSRLLFRDSDFLQKRVGSICHLRVPIRLERVAELPQSLLSVKDGRPYIQNLVPYGHSIIRGFTDQLFQYGIDYVGVTSLNDSAKAEPEITMRERAVEFCQERGIDMLLLDPKYKKRDVKGSFPIVDLEQQVLVREGIVPQDTLNHILGFDLDTTTSKPAKYPISEEFILDRVIKNSPEEVRFTILQAIRGLNRV